MTSENVKSKTAAGYPRLLSSDRADGGARKDEILDTASRLFAESGLRTSLQEIADACDIRPGSLYHHFDSKEDIVVALIRRYHADLDELAAAAIEQLTTADAPAALALVTALGGAIAQTADRHAAAVQFSFYDPPAGSSDALVRLARRPPTAVVDALHAALTRAQSGGLLRGSVDLALLAERVGHTMLYVGTGLFQKHPIDRVAQALCDVFLSGIAATVPSNSDLDRSEPLRAVQQVIKTWKPEDDPGDDRAALILAAARTEFGRRGYEVTTVREIAARAGVSTGAVYRVIGSKEELLDSITNSFAQTIMLGWSAALTSGSSVVEKVDALIWLQMNVMERFPDEFRMELAWLRQSPPETSMFNWSFQAAIRSVRSLLSDGVRSGELHPMNASMELMSRCLLALTWMPEDSVRNIGKRAALNHARDTVLRGALKP